MDAKQESEKLTNAMRLMADILLKKLREFQPFGGYMKPNGEIVDVGVKDPNTEHPKSEDMIDALRSSFRKQARAKQCKAIAIVVNVTLRSSWSAKSFRIASE